MLYMRKVFLIYEEMRKYFPIYGEAVSHTYMTLHLLHSEFPYIWGKFYFLFDQFDVKDNSLYDVGVSLPSCPVDGAVPLLVQLTQVRSMTSQNLPRDFHEFFFKLL